jgi:hypothetical protein
MSKLKIGEIVAACLVCLAVGFGIGRINFDRPSPLTFGIGATSAQVDRALGDPDRIVVVKNAYQAWNRTDWFYGPYRMQFGSDGRLQQPVDQNSTP